MNMIILLSLLCSQRVFFDPVLITDDYIYDKFGFRQVTVEAPDRSVVITLAGDINMSASKTYVDSGGAVSSRGVLTFSVFSDSIKGQINGDINYCNLETVVLNDNTLRHADKSFCFRMHTNAFRHLLGLGFNLFGLANNHMEDYGAQGIIQTIDNISALQSDFTFSFAGAGKNYEESVKPSVFEVKGHTFAFSSIGISGLPATRYGAGVALTSFCDRVLQELSVAEADYRILAVHAGLERNEFVTQIQTSVFRKALDEYKIDLVVGTHPHIVQGVEYNDGRIAFYSLGNFLMLGARDMSTVENSYCKKDFGLFVRIYLSDSLDLDSVTVHPVFNMHFQPYFLVDSVSVRRRIDWLNRISFQPYLSPGGEKVHFESDGSRGIFVP
ncbi:CapA family protein [candidate division WOR-3 bacterium]|nr:CapA family protein [candidate division WOR-3 bacterium]